MGRGGLSRFNLADAAATIPQRSALAAPWELADIV